MKTGYAGNPFNGLVIFASAFDLTRYPLPLLSRIALGLAVAWPLSTGAANVGTELDLDTLAARMAQRVQLSPAEQDWIAAGHTVRIRAAENPPYHFDTKAPKGISVDYAQVVCKAFKLRCEFIPFAGGTFAESLVNIGSGNGVDVILSARRSPERERQALLTQEYLYSPLVILNRTGSENVFGVDDLANRTVVVEKGFLIAERLRRSVADVRFIEVDSTPLALQALADGQGDAYVGDLTTTTYLVAQMGLSNLKIAAPTGFPVQGESMMVRKDWPALASTIDKALEALTPQEKQVLRNRWIAIRYDYGVSRNVALGLAAATLLLLLILGVYLRVNARLRREIAARTATEQTLQRRNAMLERTETMAVIGSFEWEIKTNLTTWSPEMFCIYGRDPALGAPNLQEQVELYTPQSAQRLYDAVDKLLLDGTPYELELMSVQPDGEQRPCWVKGFPERDASGRVVRLAGLVLDITERKLAEHYERFRSKTLELLATNEPLATLLETIVLGVEQLYPAMRCSILLLDADGIHLGKGVAPSLPDFYNAALDGIAIGVGVGSCGTAAFTGERVIVDDIATHPYWALYKDLAASAELGACWSQPIHSSSGKVLGTFAMYHRTPHTPGHADIHLIEQVANLASIAIERKEHQNQLEHIAHFDALTNLPNRALLADRLQQAMVQEQRRGQQLAVAYLDLDGFKAVNDRHGHNVGDQLLIELAKRMKDALREGDTLARIGGDEFVAVLVDLVEPAVSEPVLNRLLAAAALPVQVGDMALQVSASLGVTFFPQPHGIDADQLLRQADQAMYQAKVAGKNRYHVFDAAQDSNLRGHHESLERIRLALAQGEFVLHYQPKVNMRSGQVVGAEALIRWQHPEKGLLAPATFLPVIEDHPLAVAVGEWVIDTAMQQMHVWQATGLHLPVSVNIGARQLQQINFVERLKAILAQHPQVNPADLELEVLETSALEDIALVSGVIEDCAMIGVKFALDDFGTGYSSLTYLKRLRVALLKIDQSFVRDMLDDPDDLAILEGVIGLAVAFRREVIAEGVETVAHGTALLQLGCELAQGYGIARPMPAEQLPAWAATWQPDAAWRVPLDAGELPDAAVSNFLVRNAP